MAAADTQTVLANLLQRRTDASAELVALTNTPPDYSIDGQSVQWTAKLKALRDEIKDLNDLISNLSAPWEVRSRCVSG